MGRGKNAFDYTSLLSVAGCLRGARHCVSRGCVTAAADGEAKKRRAWETCRLTFLNQIWQSGA